MYATAQSLTLIRITLILKRLSNTLNALKAGGIAVAGVVIDGVDFSKVKEADIQAVASYAKATKTRVWISATAEGDKLEDSAPKALLEYFTAVIHLVSKSSVTQVSILKMGKRQTLSPRLSLIQRRFLLQTSKSRKAAFTEGRFY